MFVQLYFSYVFMSVKFELHVMSRAVDVNYACYVLLVGAKP